MIIGEEFGDVYLMLLWVEESDIKKFKLVFEKFVEYCELYKNIFFEWYYCN